ncbi:MAG: ATP-binding protein [Deltaproteobacteria bacterium]|nr:ATP-binding protein [Deltaproteobacteria bacterium]
MWSRILGIGNNSSFIFGPRGVGKSTLLRQTLPQAKLFSLLQQSEYLRFLTNPSDFRREVLALPRGSWIVVDEIQKIPALLDEIHAIMNEVGESHFHFAITGSSARKLRKENANLLAGRARNRKLFPLVHAELQFDTSQIEEILEFGTLPAVRTLSTPDRIQFLESYVATFLQQEIQQEALAKHLDSFVRFLKVAALMNGQLVNVSATARDSGVARTSVQGYFDILVDTLVGTWLPAWQPRAKVKETQHPKFYFFDPGVVRTITSQLRDGLDSVEKGFLLETYIFHELRAAMEYQSLGGELSYWRSGDRELDFIWTRGKVSVGIEVKSSERWKPEFASVGNELVSKKILDAAFGVYLGEKALVDGEMKVFPLIEFLTKVSAGKVLSRG